MKWVNPFDTFLNLLSTKRGKKKKEKKNKLAGHGINSSLECSYHEIVEV